MSEKWEGPAERAPDFLGNQSRVAEGEKGHWTTWGVESCVPRWAETSVRGGGEHSLHRKYAFSSLVTFD